MKSNWKCWTAILGLALIPVLLPAQDDLYYNPDHKPPTEEPRDKGAEPVPPGYRETLPPYRGEDGERDYWDEQGFQYSSRIRRFHRPYGSFGYFDPIYSDMGFYDPWMMPGTSIYVGLGGYSDYWYWRRMNRWRFGFGGMYGMGYHSFGMRHWMDPWSFGTWGAYRVYDPWFDPYWGGACYNRGWMPGWGFGSPFMPYSPFWGQGWASGPGYWYGHPNGIVDTRPGNTYYGPRLSDARSGPFRNGPGDPEYSGGGIPRLRDALSAGERQQAAAPRGLPEESVRGKNPDTREQLTRQALTPAGGARPETVAPDDRISPPARGTISPATPDRRDPLADRPRFRDGGITPAQDLTREERSRESYRRDYLRQREQDMRPSNPRTVPQADPRRYESPTPSQRPMTRPSPEQQRTPDTRQDQRTRPMPDTRPRWETTPPVRGGDSPMSSPSGRGFDRGGQPPVRSASPAPGGAPSRGSAPSPQMGPSRRGG